jgi:hypothetical protein
MVTGLRPGRFDLAALIKASDLERGDPRPHITKGALRPPVAGPWRQPGNLAC